ncbi:MAG: helix-turn-helix domain-containing protein [Clostridia bacterium]|jgi:SOS-response transcriptional repressor LexA|nr:helix-turn-helix domain-containing protein [Clostridia bacterium]MBQ1963739.1 helix-turn-helix domain-containing protein [Clostridia bacterium]MBQ5833938.1 helix-turn-helix domain-containing protein [Clostridia bacterium]
MENYIDRIKKKKSERRLTNEQLAGKSGIPLGTLSKMLAGMSDSPKLSNIVALCNALDCSVEYIVSGTPENTNNYTLQDEEISLIEDFRLLDSWGQNLVKQVLSMESERVGAAAVSVEESASSAKKRSARVLQTPAAFSARRYAGEEVRTEKRQILLYDMPVSAGVGIYLDADAATSIQIPNTEKTHEADYALRIRGNSMEPKFHNEDILLVESTDAVEVGELGIFLLDGEAFFKVYGGDCLRSLNPEYGPIPLKDYTDVQCKGRVITRLKRK